MTTATERRIQWTTEVAEIAKTMPRLACLLIANEWRTLGRARGWRSAGGWFEAYYRHEIDMTWLAWQSLIWFGREV
jgi:hypothetical protein